MAGTEELAAHLARFNSAPFLFIGSGLSRRYLGLETWEGLLRLLAEATGQPYAYFATAGDGNLPDVASVLAERFHELWWSDERFARSRELFADGLSSREGPLKVEVARYMAEAIQRLPSEGDLADELDFLKHAVIDGVITTNYDALLESVLEDFHVYIGQDELLFSDPQGVGEIYKIHGSCDRPESLVLTRRDYDRYHERNPYLAAKLLTVFVEHPVIFAGYSLSDPNVTEILVSVARCLTTENLNELQDRLIFIEWDADAEESRLVSTAIAVGGFTIPVVSMKVADFKGVFEVLTRLRRKFPARLLRRLKQHVYELVLTNDPKGKLSVQDLDSQAHMDEIEVVFGVGLRQQLGMHGYIGLGRKDLLLDVLQPTSGYEAVRVVEALPVILRSPGNVPIYRYLRDAGLLTAVGSVREDVVLEDHIQRRVARGLTPLLPTASLVRKGRAVVAAADEEFGTLLDQAGVEEAVVYAGFIARELLDLEELRAFLLVNAYLFDTTAHTTAWAKLVCLYDYYAFGPGQSAGEPTE